MMEWKWKRAKNLKCFQSSFCCVSTWLIVFFDCTRYSFAFCARKFSAFSRNVFSLLNDHTPTHWWLRKIHTRAAVIHYHCQGCLRLVAVKGCARSPSPHAHSISFACDRRYESAIDFRTTPNVNTKNWLQGTPEVKRATAGWRQQFFLFFSLFCSSPKCWLAS